MAFRLKKDNYHQASKVYYNKKTKMEADVSRFDGPSYVTFISKNGKEVGHYPYNIFSKEGKKNFTKNIGFQKKIKTKRF